MLTKKQLGRYADVLIWGLKTSRAAKLDRKDVILVRFDLPALELAEILQARLLDMGMHPILRMNATAAMESTFYEKANQRQLVFQPPGNKGFFNGLNGTIFLRAPESITHLSHVDPKKIGKAAVAGKYTRDILNKRDEKGLYSWTLCMLPTEALARHAGVPLETYAQQVIKACFLNKTKPIQAWQDVYRKAADIKRWLDSLDVDYLHVTAESIDLRITPGEQRRWLGISGHNIPSFEIFISPDWRHTQGTFHADQPSYRSGNLVEGVSLRFNKGKVVSAQALNGEAFLKKQLSMDSGASRLGEFSLTDKRFSKIDRFMANTLYDENFGGRFGNCHVALGSSYSEAYSDDRAKLTKRLKTRLGFNDSALHWDLVNTEKKQVTAHLRSGKSVVIYENGRFTR